MLHDIPIRDHTLIPPDFGMTYVDVLNIYKFQIV
jgi:hypothetical protein